MPARIACADSSARRCTPSRRMRCPMRSFTAAALRWTCRPGPRPELTAGGPRQYANRMRFFSSFLFLVLVAAFPAVAARPVCPDGRFVQNTHILPGSADGAFDTVKIENGQVSIESGCEATKVHLKGKKDGTTRVHAKWKTCGTLKKVRLIANIVADGDVSCAKLTGSVRAKKNDPFPVDATRTRCGDGVVDPAEGEECDPPGA